MGVWKRRQLGQYKGKKIKQDRGDMNRHRGFDSIGTSGQHVSMRKTEGSRSYKSLISSVLIYADINKTLLSSR